MAFDTPSLRSKYIFFQRSLHAIADDANEIDRTLERVGLTSDQVENGIRFKFGAPSALSANEEPNIDAHSYESRPQVGNDIASLILWGKMDANCEMLILDADQITDSGLFMLLGAMGQGHVPKCRTFGITGLDNPRKTDLLPACDAILKGALLECELLEFTGTQCTIGFYRRLVNALQNPVVLPELKFLYLGGIDWEAPVDENLESVMNDLDAVTMKRGVHWSYIYSENPFPKESN